MVTIISGANELTLNLAGRTITSVQTQYAEALNIPTGAKGQINGKPVGGSDVLKNGDRLVFAAATAEKGI